MPGSLISAIEIRNACPKAFYLSLPELRRTAVSILKKTGFKQAGLSLLLVGDRRMRMLNRKFLNHDWTTDVITFSYQENKRQRSQAPVCAGEIIISLDTAKKTAEEFGHSPRYEFYFYLCHGILHLAGYDDDTPRKRTAMLKKQEEILKAVGIQKR
ncbi:MAG: rRNA maturation RNase YbeY [Candidatus Omnitrophica bacterium]|nr:rRNA maturation RNase YbeY [Candidatus Omnitrophota bacterium]